MDGYADFDEWYDSMLRRLRRIKVGIILLTSMSIGILIADNVDIYYENVIISELKEMEEALSSIGDIHEVIKERKDTKRTMSARINKNDVDFSERDHEASTKPGETVLKTQVGTEEVNSRHVENENYFNEPPCNGTIFHLEILLVGTSPDISWELQSISTNVVTAYESYKDDDGVLDKVFELCVVPGPYVFSMFDSSKNGDDAEFHMASYRIFLDNELQIEGSPYAGEIIVHYFDSSSSFCVVGSIFTLQLKNIYSIWYLIDHESEEIIELYPTSSDEDGNTSQSYHFCLSPGKYDFKLYDEDKNRILCTNSEDCFSNLFDRELYHQNGYFFEATQS